MLNRQILHEKYGNPKPPVWLLLATLAAVVFAYANMANQRGKQEEYRQEERRLDMHQSEQVGSDAPDPHDSQRPALGRDSRDRPAR